jgi:hypothetical protein
MLALICFQLPKAKISTTSLPFALAAILFALLSFPFPLRLNVHAEPFARAARKRASIKTA